jgi:hypothetical protein
MKVMQESRAARVILVLDFQLTVEHIAGGTGDGLWSRRCGARTLRFGDVRGAGDEGKCRGKDKRTGERDRH